MINGLRMFGLRPRGRSKKTERDETKGRNKWVGKTDKQGEGGGQIED